MSCNKIVCRCEEVTEEEILEAIQKGRHTVTSVKKATRAGMGACQGRTCGRLVSQLLIREGVDRDKALEADKQRFPLVPVTIASLDCKEE